MDRNDIEVYWFNLYRDFGQSIGPWCHVLVGIKWVIWNVFGEGEINEFIVGLESWDIYFVWCWTKLN